MSDSAVIPNLAMLLKTAPITGEGRSWIKGSGIQQPLQGSVMRSPTKTETAAVSQLLADLFPI